MDVYARGARLLCAALLPPHQTLTTTTNPPPNINLPRPPQAAERKQVKEQKEEAERYAAKTQELAGLTTESYLFQVKYITFIHLLAWLVGWLNIYLCVVCLGEGAKGVVRGEAPSQLVVPPHHLTRPTTKTASPYDKHSCST